MTVELYLNEGTAYRGAMLDDQRNSGLRARPWRSAAPWFVSALLLLAGCGRRPDVDSFVALSRAARDLELLRAELRPGAPAATNWLRRSQLKEAVHALRAELDALDHPVMYQPVANSLDMSAAALEAAYGTESTTRAETLALGAYRTNQTEFVVHITLMAPKPTRPPPKRRKRKPTLTAEERELGAALALAADAPASAVEKLIPLARRTRNTPTGATVSLALARMLSRFEIRDALGPDFQPPPIDLAISEFESIFEQECYSPALFDAFLRWRTLQQIYRFGIHPDSPIPNQQYNATRNRLISHIRERIRKEPRDKHAWNQLQGLCLCPNIISTPLGNSATEDDRMLNPHIAKKESDARIGPALEDGAPKSTPRKVTP